MQRFVLYDVQVALKNAKKEHWKKDKKGGSNEGKKVESDY